MAIELVLLARMADSRRAAAASSAKSVALDRLVLEDGLDDQLGRRRRFGQDSARPTPDRGSASRCSSRDLALGHGALEVGADACAAGLGAGHLRLVERHVVAGRGHDLGDAVAHQPRAANEDVALCHGQSLARGALARAGRGARSAAVKGSISCAATARSVSSRARGARGVVQLSADALGEDAADLGLGTLERGAIRGRANRGGGVAAIESGEQLGHARAGQRRAEHHIRPLGSRPALGERGLVRQRPRSASPAAGRRRGPRPAGRTC